MPKIKINSTICNRCPHYAGKNGCIYQKNYSPFNDTIEYHQSIAGHKN